MEDIQTTTTKPTLIKDGRTYTMFLDNYGRVVSVFFYTEAPRLVSPIYRVHIDLMPGILDTLWHAFVTNTVPNDVLTSPLKIAEPDENIDDARNEAWEAIKQLPTTL